MALYKNEITLQGYIGKDAESFATKNQKPFTVLSLATKSGFQDKQTNEWVNHTEWHRIVAFGKPAEFAKNLPLYERILFSVRPVFDARKALVGLVPEAVELSPAEVDN